ncbi:hypothetical protein RyT2_07930 [Pseudolactococcus yaeyamensis]
MTKTRIYEIARNLDMTSKETLAISKELGFEAKTASSSLDEGQIEAIEDYLNPPKPKKKKSAEKTAKKTKKKAVKQVDEDEFEDDDIIVDESDLDNMARGTPENYKGMSKKEIKRYRKAQKRLVKQAKTRQKVDKKAVKLPKQHSQRKANVIVYSAVIGLVALSAFSLFSNGMRNFKQSSPQTVAVQKAESGYTNNKINLFLSSYVGTYFNKGLDKSNQDILAPFYGGDLLDIKNTQTNAGAYELINSTLLEIKDNVGSYTVNYRVKSNEADSWHDVSTIFNVPFGEKSGKYYVSGLPFVTKTESLQANKVKQNKLDDITSIYDEAWRTKANHFVAAFFNAYTSDDNTLTTMSKGIKAITGYKFKSLDYSYYELNQDETKLTAKVQVTFEDNFNMVHSENFTLELTKKEDMLFVSELIHGIKADTSKKDKGNEI